MNSWDCPAVDASDVTVKRRVQPRFPAAAMETGQPGDVTCVLVFRIDETGKPVDLEIEESCPAVYHDSLREAGWKWRFYPYKNEQGQNVHAQFSLRVKFRLN